jgi:hypothetical protein
MPAKAGKGDMSTEERSEARALLKEKRDESSRMESNAGKQLAHSMSAVGGLKDVGWTRWREDFEAQAAKHKWHAAVLNDDVKEPTEESEKIKFDHDLSNAYELIRAKSRDSQVESLLGKIYCDIGDATKAYGIVKNYHIDKTTGGVQDAQFKFYSSSMEKSGMDVVHWCAAVLSMAADLKEVTELEINDKSCLSVMVRGLLPEFMPIVTLINIETNITYIDAQRKLFSFAKVNSILDLKKGGGKSSKDSIFSMDGKPECKGWRMNRCMYGDSSVNTPILVQEDMHLWSNSTR